MAEADRAASDAQQQADRDREVSDEPVHLPLAILRSSRAEPAPVQVQRPQVAPTPAAFQIGRRTDNELILFDKERSESWIVYPPRSAYEFLGSRRPQSTSTVVEHHPWDAFISPVDHVIDPRSGCLAHGLACPAQATIATAVRLGYDPFS